ncbi:hypothetical protein [Arcicella rosea]|uniref:Tetratricopeptide repeat-containing protein n=1 Tax=Arcicella rosea TaxID=502909 RepID=A0A841ET94_9BACT|nr:hypothetical protein [Arcicella rosea]MBB6003888.1 hypothetical protein [Arcicella rosea]
MKNISGKETALQISSIQLLGQLCKEDYEKAMAIYQTKIDFLDECLKVCELNDYQTIFEEKEKYLTLHFMLKNC